MKTRSVRYIALAAVASAATLGATQTPTTNNFGLRLGVVLPTGSEMRDAFGNSGFEVGVEYFLKDLPNMRSSVAVDFVRIGGGDNFQFVSLGYTGRYYQTPRGNSNSAPYFGFSAGVSFNRASASTGGGGGSGGDSSHTAGESKTQPFGEAIVGYRVNEKVGVEAFYRLNPNFNGSSTNAIGVRAAFRF